MRHIGLCPTLRKTGLCQAAVRKWTSWSRKVAFHPTLLPNAFIHDAQADQLGLGWTWIASLLPLVLKILLSPKIKSAMKIRYLWNKEGWQRRGKQQKDNKMNYIITNIWLNTTRFIIACFHSDYFVGLPNNLARKTFLSESVNEWITDPYYVDRETGSRVTWLQTI